MKTIWTATIFLCFTLPAASQNWHIGIHGGMANYQGDLVDKYYDFKQTHGAIGISASYELYDQIMLKAGLTHATISGNDAYNKSASLVARNLSSATSLTELSFVGEFYLNNLYYRRYSPYLFAGVALFHYNPFTRDAAGNKVFLKPLSTEGQGISGYDQKPYGLTQFALPLGAGIKFALTDNIRLGVEAGLRKTFTDYLDDVSTSYADATDLLNARGTTAVALAYRGDELPGGDPAYPTKGAQRGGEKYKDLYYFTGINISFRIGKKTDNNGRFRPSKRSRNACPAVPL